MIPTEQIRKNEPSQKEISAVQLLFETGEVINFPLGLPGFETLNRFQIAQIKDFPPFYLLKSLEDANVSMLIINAKLIETSSKVKIPENELIRYGYNMDDVLEYYVILKVDNENKQLTANLRAPLVFKFSENVAHQIILEDTTLPTNHPLNAA